MRDAQGERRQRCLQAPSPKVSAAATLQPPNANDHEAKADQANGRDAHDGKAEMLRIGEFRQHHFRPLPKPQVQLPPSASTPRVERP